MTKELEVWQFAAEKLKNGETVMLLVVAESAGSSPGRQGFKMVVAEDEMCGSIGGGVMEVSLVERAKEILRSKIENPKSKIIEQIHRKNAPNSSGMICSGWQKVILFKLTGELYPRVRHIPRYIKVRRRPPRYLRLTPNEVCISSLGRFKNHFDFKFEQKTPDEFVYEERFRDSRNNLFIVGGGHCALALSELMSKLNFHISLFDDRNDLNTLEKNRFADEKQIIESYDKIGDFIASGENDFIVVMTLGYKSDAIVIKKLLDKNFKYLGVLGSTAKMKTLLRDLEKEGFAKEKLAQIHTPIGLPINSRTPEEIAVSIAAEIIAVKNSETKPLGRASLDTVNTKSFF